MAMEIKSEYLKKVNTLSESSLTFEQLHHADSINSSNSHQCIQWFLKGAIHTQHHRQHL